MTEENVEDTRDVSDNINYDVDGNGLTDLTTCLSRGSQKPHRVHHTSLSLLSRGTDNLSLTDEVDVS